jgi:hypothetical protein
MQYLMACDNCGKKAVSNCFGPEEEIVTFYTPPILMGAIKTNDDFVEHMIEMASRHITLVCRSCMGLDPA